MAGIGPFMRAFILNWPAKQVVTVDNFPASQKVNDDAGSLTVDTGTPGKFNVSFVPSSDAANGIIPIRASGAATLTLKTSAGNLYSAYAVALDPGFTLMALDRATPLVVGAAIPTAEIISLVPAPANGHGSISPPDIPDRFVNGCVLIATTSRTVFTPPNQGPVFIRGKVA